MSKRREMDLQLLIDELHLSNQVSVKSVDQATHIQLLRRLSQQGKREGDIKVPLGGEEGNSSFALLHRDGSVAVTQMANGRRHNYLYTLDGRNERVTATIYGGEGDKIPFLHHQTVTLEIRHRNLLSPTRKLETWTGFVATQRLGRMSQPRKLAPAAR